MQFLSAFGSTLIDIAPIAAIVFFFQYVVVRKPVKSLPRVLVGFAMVWVGLSLFLFGLGQALFPLGDLMATQLVSTEVLPELATDEPRHWTDYYWVYLFAFAIGGATTIAEPSLIAVALKAGEISAGAIKPLALRIAVALGAATGICLGTWRIITGAPLHWLVIGAYVVVILQTFTAPRVIIPLAYDSGGVTTSTITVPIVTALGLGLASTIPGRSPLTDGFGMIALAVNFPIITVLGYAKLAEWLERRRPRASAFTDED